MFDFLRKKPVLSASAPSVSAPASAVLAVVDVSGFDKFIKFCLYAAVLLIPLLFTSLTSEVREFNKQTLLVFSVILMLGAWLIKILTTRKASWIKTSLDYILLVYLLVYLLASLTSIDKVSSFLGYFGRFTGSFLSIASFVVLYFLVVNNIRSEKAVNRIMDFLVLSMSVVLGYSLLQLFGVYLLPFDFTHARSFNPVGSQASLAIFTAVSLIFFQFALYGNFKPSKIYRWALIFLSLVALAVLLLINSFVAWLTLALGMIAFIALAISLRSEEAGHGGLAGTWRPMIVLVIAILFVSFQFLPQVINPRNLININLPVEIQLSNSSTWNLVKNSFSSPKQAVLGSGPGTVGIVFGQIKPETLNKTIVWNLTFDRASSEIANLAIETGALGLLAFELASILFLISGLLFILKKSGNKTRLYAFGFYVIWLALYISHFFYFFNTTFYFLFWLSLAMFMAIMNWGQTAAEEKKSSQAPLSARSTLSWMFASLLVLALLLLSGFFQAAVFGAEMSYAAGIKELRKASPDLNASAVDFSRAITLNPYRDVYYLAYGQNLIFLASAEVQKNDRDLNKIKNLVYELINSGKIATQISPNKASNWSTLAQFYSNIKPLAAGADKLIIEQLQKAVDLDPKNPALHFQLGQAYAAMAVIEDAEKKTTKIDPEQIEKAQYEMNRAIELKPDLAQFYIQLSRVHENAKQMDKAKELMDKAAQLFPNNPDVLFEQGRLAFNLQKIDEAEKIFNKVLAINPDYANALYSLGRIYQLRSENDKALAQYKKVIELTGPNQDIDKLIEALESGKKK